MRFKRKETNNFEHAIFGIDLFFKYVFSSLKKRKKHHKKTKALI